MGLDWEPPAQLPGITDIFTSYAMDHTNMLVVSMGEGEIVGTDTTTGYHGQWGLFITENLTSLAMPLYGSPLHICTWPLQLRSKAAKDLVTDSEPELSYPH